MKKILTVAAIAIYIFLPVVVLAQTQTATPSPSIAADVQGVEDEDIKYLKEKIATKVAELREKNSRAVSGMVTAVSNKVVKITTSAGKDFDIQIDDTLTKFYQISGILTKEATFQQIKKNSYIIVTGMIGDKTVDANVIYLDESYLVMTGKITEVNKDDYYVKVSTSEKATYTLDIETYTKEKILNIKTLVLEAVGFSKLKEGDTVHFVVKRTGTEKEPNRYPAQRIVIIPQEYFIK
jgi:hypothetical protein